ncbi:bifunctional 2-polyprenyl-6-hydroxyphenol methylase/3-demethylubiquinol 3-O-methyltransferase UbiG [Oxalobacter vibrioformis]|uniref:Ubiquinone biosynthesis O-methyltransferase n=1 Tax=Oxalobacter vibrioformis TaxID=933080 RepID=A0A9E9LTH7_9BURK|nr:bifunctional 2-polyprenyl-6-hydroxyphenol methylase/3-demethylubiquinol 3-O-methyltransferase UbiG [Oxalobacter vibrioformis]WAW09350.1 bifunctional 2-polyprenyl-6-hydroxyphenol methylase/3-demethylubiquinol 3-O-methyltransferase UbiG [Oxalobacter vibrioformis]
MNVDQAELLKFNALAGKWWDTNGAFRFLHALNPLRLQWIESLSPLREKQVLDIGCGGGILSEAMARCGAIVTGIDMAGEAIRAAEAHRAQSGLSIDYRLMSAETLAGEEPGKYDIVTCLEMLEHVPDPVSIISAAARLVKPEGMVYFATLNRNLKSFIYAIAGAEYILGLLPKGTHQHARFLTPAELSRHVRNTGMEVTAITGISSNLTASHFYLSRDVSINYMMACQRLL